MKLIEKMEDSRYDMYGVSCIDGFDFTQFEESEVFNIVKTCFDKEFFVDCKLIDTVVRMEWLEEEGKFYPYVLFGVYFKYSGEDCKASFGLTPFGCRHVYSDINFWSIKENLSKQFAVFMAEQFGDVYIKSYNRNAELLKNLKIEKAKKEAERKIIKAKENRSVHKNNNAKLEHEESKSKVENIKLMIEYNDGRWNKVVDRIKNFFRLK